MQPIYKHHDRHSSYLGNETVDGKAYDYYYSPQHGLPTVIARFGENEHYFSGLMMIRAQLNTQSELSFPKQVLEIKNNAIHNEDKCLYVLAVATLLSVEQGFLDEQLKATPQESSVKTLNKKFKT